MPSVIDKTGYQTPRQIREALAADGAAAQRDRAELRRSLSQQIGKLDQLYAQRINELKAVQEAQTDHWEKRWAGDAVTMGQYSRRKDISQLRTKLEKSKDSMLELVERSITFHKEIAEHDIAQAREKLQSIQQGVSGQ